ncbi:MAG: iron-containing alcohol dehydrogenase [Deltaproteobacteria bacterium]|jgi:alcohol dehydrogenase class IV|nr:iron-containing alcohol dehydrogenase [Deltaproteobacteria bacterium]
MHETHRLYIKPQIITGKNALGYLDKSVTGRVGVITDAFMVSSGMLAGLLRHLAGCEVEVFSGVTPDPSVEVVLKGTRAMAAFGPGTIIAFGGGSPIDAAKAVIASLRGMGQNGNIAFIAIPTTSGSGSEVTGYAIISEAEGGIKLPLISDDMLPDAALLDPELTQSLPPPLTADTGMDVIAHGLEAYVARKADDFSDAFAEKALALACVWLPVAYADGADLEARKKMHAASCMAGIAFNTAGLGLCHGLSHAAGGAMHLPHGRINAMLLPHVVEFNAGLEEGFSPKKVESAAQRYAMLTRRLKPEVATLREGARGLAREIRRLNALMKIPATLREAGVNMAAFEEQREKVIKAALADAATACNPRAASPADVGRLLDLVAGRHGRWR